MGVIFSRQAFEAFKNRGCMKPIVFCFYDEKLCNKAISLNVPLSKELIKIKEEYRTTHIKECVQKLVNEFPDDSIIKDFDVLFNHSYKIDTAVY